MGAPVLTLGYLEAAGARALATAGFRPDPAGLPPLLYPILPAVRDDKGLLAVPALGWCREAGVTLPEVFFGAVNCLSDGGFAIVPPQPHLIC
jgi:hypothetical protein